MKQVKQMILTYYVRARTHARPRTRREPYAKHLLRCFICFNTV